MSILKYPHLKLIILISINFTFIYIIITDECIETTSYEIHIQGSKMGNPVGMAVCVFYRESLQKFLLIS